ncbi:MAG: DNA recombination protein RmuC [Candidatus Omnitrophica bacterium]|nr:DNA recombination protein RmuC [Candidatus Omnitrophota bacterium]
MTIVLILIAVIILVILGAAVFKINSSLNSQMFNISREVSEKLGQLGEALNNTHKIVGDRLDGSAQIISKVHSALGEIKESYRQINEKMKEFSSFQDMLKPPKIRGGVGETMLESIISQVFADKREFYDFQYQFKSGEKVDAVIKLGGNVVSIDAKFPLESYRRMKDAQNEEERRQYKREFASSVKFKIDDIAKKYILPDEGTFDFALMYIPAEGIYYEIIQDNQVWSYSLDKKVIPVSPNTFYPYLMVIWRGLRGMALEKNIEGVLVNLKRTEVEFLKFKDEFRVLGSHLKNAREKFDDVDKRLERFSDKLSVVSNIPLEDKR